MTKIYTLNLLNMNNWCEYSVDYVDYVDYVDSVDSVDPCWLKKTFQTYMEVFRENEVFSQTYCLIWYCKQKFMTKI